MAVKKLTRRRTLMIMAGGIGALAAGPALRGIAATREYTWRGVALGADARLTLCHSDEAVARTAIAACLDEVERLEREFSLYREASALSLLNREGALEKPSMDMIAVLKAGRRLSELTDGAFDYTLQPLWRAIAAKGERPLSGAKLSAALDLVDYRKVTISPASVRLGGDQQITLNGIAQGYITDRVTEILHELGWRDVLVGLGEVRASGRRADGAPWKIVVDNGAGGASQNSPKVALQTGAIAVSSGAGLYLDVDRRHNHLIDPRNGTSPAGDVSIAVHASSAMLADGLSTALGLVPLSQWTRILRASGAHEAWRITPNDPPQHFGRGG